MTVSDDSLLRRLAALDADDGLTDLDRRALERLCAGQLPAIERDALSRRAQERVDQGDGRLRDAVAAHEPLAAEARARIADAVAGKFRRPAPAAAPRAAVATPRAPRRRGFLFWLMPTFAAGAAALALWPRVPGGGELPRYSLDVGGGMNVLRGPSAPALGRLTPAAPLRLNLRPRTRVSGAASVRTFVEAAGQWTAVPVAWEHDDSGAFHAEGTVSSLLGPVSGSIRLHLVIGREEILSRAGDRLARAAEDAGSGWQRLTVALEIAATASP